MNCRGIKCFRAFCTRATRLQPHFVCRNCSIKKTLWEMSPFSEQMTNRKSFANILHILRDARINFQRLTLLLIERLLSGPLTCVDVQRLTKGSNISTMTTAQINFGFDFSQTAQEKNCITAFVHTHRHTHLRVLGWVI